MNLQSRLDEFNSCISSFPPICTGSADVKQKHTVAAMKRLVDWYCNDDKYRERFQTDSAAAVAELGLDIAVNDAVIMIKMLDEGVLTVPLAEIPLSCKLYYSYMYEKILWRSKAQDELDAPRHPAFREWRKKQINRCWGQFGGDNYSFVHVPLVFEMAVGCSVGCPFCALSSESLKKLFRAEQANLQLWEDVLDVAKEIVGPAAGEGVLYFATEPLDNPDYEQFAAIFEEKLGKVPQITTAVAMRNPERLRKIIHRDHQKENITIHRFSMLTIEDFHGIVESFTPDELLYVELLGRYPESLLGTLTKAGRSYEGESVAAIESTNTISCCTGFIVNMADKTLRLTCPTDADDEHPTGELQSPRYTFTDAENLKKIMLDGIKEYMPISMDMRKKLGFASFYIFEPIEEGFKLSSKAGFRVSLKQENKNEMQYYKRVGELLVSGKYTGREIVSILIDERRMNPSLVFNFLRHLDRMGALVYLE